MELPETSRPVDISIPFKVHNTFLHFEESSDEELEVETGFSRAVSDPLDALPCAKRESKLTSMGALPPISEKITNVRFWNSTSPSPCWLSQKSGQGGLDIANKKLNSNVDVQEPVYIYGHHQKDKDYFKWPGTGHAHDSSSSTVVGQAGDWESFSKVPTTLGRPPMYKDLGWNPEQSLQKGSPLSAQGASNISDATVSAATVVATAAAAAAAAAVVGAVLPTQPPAMENTTAPVRGHVAYPAGAVADAMLQGLSEITMCAQTHESNMKSMGAMRGDAALDANVAEQNTLTVIRALSFSVTLADPLLPDCPLIGCSQGFEALTGYHRTEIIGHNCRFLNRHAGLSAQVRRKIREAVQNGTECIEILQNVKKNGEQFRNLLHLSSITVRGKRYLVGIQADAAQLPVDNIDVSHATALRSVAEKIFSGHLDVWILTQAHAFSFQLPAPYSKLLKTMLPDKFDQALECYVQVGESQPSHHRAALHAVDKPNCDSASTTAMSDISGDLEEASTASNETVQPMQHRQISGLADSKSTKLDGCINLKSLGSAQHPNGCVECCFFFFGASGCRYGADCTFCHAIHQRANRKKNRRLIRRLETMGAVPPETKDVMQELTNAPSLVGLPAGVQGHITESPMYLTEPASCPAESGERDMAESDPVGGSDTAKLSSRQQLTTSLQLQGDVNNLLSIQYGKPDERVKKPQIMLLVGVRVKIPVKIDFGTPDDTALEHHVTFSVEPPLPHGLNLHISTGLISGTPTSEIERATYVVTAATAVNDHTAVAVSTSFSLGVSDLRNYTMCWSSEVPGQSGSNLFTLELRADSD